ncbi:MAG: GNAT family N-acetyltransferase [Lactobacillales bacterium]|jgi:GNAT superfamily N-acetyltransferase|nr:GNAT family N-acetyltransferase [Lactobacillales bacterium]
MQIHKIKGKEITPRGLREKKFNPKEDVDAYLKLQEEVVTRLPLKEVWGNWKRADLESLCDEDTYMWLYYDGDVLVAMMAMCFNDRTQFDKHAPVPAPFEKTAILEGTIIHPDYRGNGLQQQLMRERERIAKSMGFDFMLATVSPHNAYSLKNTLALGYKAVGQKQMKRGLRTIFVKEL